MSCGGLQLAKRVEADGIIIRNAAEHPDHQRSYVTSGDFENESYRLSTFSRFPGFAPVSTRELARSGFYYAGIQDQVKCYSCGLAVEDWQAGDDPSSQRWHSRECEHTAARLGTQQPGPSGQTNHHLFPCQSAVNPHMRDAETRLRTFLDSSRSWPSERIRATPAQMAAAGLFYLGERDRVKCWYCNGGLQNWEYNDEPFFEHAKWFPSCEYVLQQKGIDFVHNVTSQYPDISRPAIANAVTLNQSGGVIRQQSYAGPVIIDPKAQMRAVEARVQTDMEKSPFVTQARMMSFSDTDIRRAFLNQHLKKDEGFPSLEALVEALLALPGSQAEPARDNGSRAEITARDNGSGPSRSAVEELREQLRQCELECLCKTCRHNTATVVFLPCGHLVTCPSCAEGLTSCQACGVQVNETVHAFLV